MIYTFWWDGGDKPKIGYTFTINTKIEKVMQRTILLQLIEMHLEGGRHTENLWSFSLARVMNIK